MENYSKNSLKFELPLNFTQIVAISYKTIRQLVIKQLGTLNRVIYLSFSGKKLPSISVSISSPGPISFSHLLL